MENWTLLTYSTYLMICLSVTYFVGRDLHQKGYFLILDLFENASFARTVNNLLLVLYYLLNMGYIAITVLHIGTVDSILAWIEILSFRVGFILFLLGSLHFNNIIVLQFLSKRRHKIVPFFNH